MGALLGGHVRFGFENNLPSASGQTPDDNAALVGACRVTLAYLGLRAASAHEMRNLFLEPRREADFSHPS